jgi:hypothetical protein
MKSNTLLAVALGTLLGGAALAQDTGATEPNPDDTQASAAMEPSPATGSAGPRGFEVGLRAGFALPLGSLAGDSGSLSDGFSGMVPLQLDLGYRVNRSWFAGAYLQYGFAFVKDAGCGSGTSCSASDLRFGLEAQYHVLPLAQLDPWVGLGIGYEVLHLSVTDTGSGVGGSVSYRGLEFANLSLGGDYKLSPTLSVGPVIQLTIAEYMNGSLSSPDLNLSSGIDNKAIHMWLSFGVRGVFDVR